MKVRYFDAHCHIQFNQYEADGAELVERMRAEGVAGVVVGTEQDSSRKAIALAEQHEHLFASVGLHPNRVTTESFDSGTYRTLANHPAVVAIGECGLDYYRPEDVNDEIKAKQQVVLREHVALAAELNKPLIIHARPSKGTQDAYRDLITILTEEKSTKPNLRGDIHFFVGGLEEMRELTALGFAVSFTAVITFARDYDEVIRNAPLSSILSETDAPYVAPASRRGERNDPLAIPEIVSKIAEIRGESEEQTRRSLLQNSLRLFAPAGLEAV